MLDLSEEEELLVAIGTLQVQLDHLKARNAAAFDRVIVAEGLLQMAMAGETCSARDCQILRNCILAFGFEDEWWLQRQACTPEQLAAEFESSDAEFRFQHGIEFLERPA
ncbi:hypothetical protein [Parahaliea aestuarii]|uniref:hypothetical protein n=1 Tax=Parahaliea aestuarii TaxID=1852021 RepID=UPI00164F427F|nr:hypothetical protein [Parahaliea aestuarii]